MSYTCRELAQKIYNLSRECYRIQNDTGLCLQMRVYKLASSYMSICNDYYQAVSRYVNLVFSLIMLLILYRIIREHPSEKKSRKRGGDMPLTKLRIIRGPDRSPYLPASWIFLYITCLLDSVNIISNILKDMFGGGSLHLLNFAIFTSKFSENASHAIFCIGVLDRFIGEYQFSKLYFHTIEKREKSSQSSSYMGSFNETTNQPYQKNTPKANIDENEDDIEVKEFAKPTSDISSIMTSSKWTKIGYGRLGGWLISLTVIFICIFTAAHSLAHSSNSSDLFITKIFPMVRVTIFILIPMFASYISIILSVCMSKWRSHFNHHKPTKMFYTLAFINTLSVCGNEPIIGVIPLIFSLKVFMGEIQTIMVVLKDSRCLIKAILMFLLSKTIRGEFKSLLSHAHSSVMRTTKTLLQKKTYSKSSYSNQKGRKIQHGFCCDMYRFNCTIYCCNSSSSGDEETTDEP